MDKFWPLPKIKADIPLAPHPGAFGVKRKYDFHTGVDLYCQEGSTVVAIESGIIINVERFTGPNADDPSPWWNDTKAILVSGSSGVICYGELETNHSPGEYVFAGNIIGKVKQVLKEDKGKPMSMLHFELYKPGTKKTVWWHNEKPFNLLDPTELLQELRNKL